MEENSEDDHDKIVTAENVCAKCDYNCVGHIPLKKHVHTKQDCTVTSMATGRGRHSLFV